MHRNGMVGEAVGSQASPHNDLAEKYGDASTLTGKADFQPTPHQGGALPLSERYAPGVDLAGWQPIATAPLDGRRLRLKIEGERGKDSQPPTGIGRPSEDFWDEGGWVMENREIWRKPTHWAAIEQMDGDVR